MEVFIKPTFYDETYNIERVIGKDLYLSKRKLFEDFFGDFYLFIKSHGGKNDLLKKNIHSKKDFYDFAKWDSDGMNNCYGMGFAFYPYFLTVEEGGKIENQPDTTFIGYCYKNGKYLDFLNFLISFFAYWRNDETCTCFFPYNHADDFFNSSWAVLVDTCKLFHFTGETVFHWISYRIKYVVDNIPGTIKSSKPTPKKLIDGFYWDVDKELPRIRISGYEFIGWFNGEEEVKYIKEDMNLTCKFKRKDFYNYWEKEWDKIPKVIEATYKKVDPA